MRYQVERVTLPEGTFQVLAVGFTLVQAITEVVRLNNAVRTETIFYRYTNQPGVYDACGCYVAPPQLPILPRPAGPWDNNRRRDAMQRYTILVVINAPSQGAAFEFVEQAIDAKLEQEMNADRAEGDIRVATPDGTQAIVF